MRTAIYPGSFNPWHDGHDDVLEKALKIFDHVIIAIGQNPNKEGLSQVFKFNDEKITVIRFTGLLTDFVKEQKACAVIRGLRNGNDLQYEQNQQYWYEDLGLKVPIVYFIADRALGHISSSAIRALKKMETE